MKMILKHKHCDEKFDVINSFDSKGRTIYRLKSFTTGDMFYSDADMIWMIFE